MISRVLAAACAALVAICGLAAPAPAQIPTRASIEAVCKPGKEPQIAGDESYPGGLSNHSGGLTPQRIPGATTVSVREAKCLVDNFGAQLVILAAMDDGDKLPHAIGAGGAADDDPAIQAPFAKAMAEVTGGNKARPILIYCHHESCFLSYNVVLRSVQAGYSNVFWMRPGILGWKKAGYAVEAAPPPPGVVEVSPNMKAEIAGCRKDYLDYDAQDWAGMLTQIPAQADQDKQFIKDRDEKARWLKLCLGNHARDARGAADKAEANKALAAADADVAAMFAKARQEVEANPARFLSMTWESHQPAKLRADLAAMKAVKTLDEACGTINFSQPDVGPRNNSYIDSLNQRRKQHGECIMAYYKDEKPINRTFGIESANKWVRATRRFTCAATGNRPNCIPNEPFNTIAGIATDANVALVNRQDKLFWDQRQRVGPLIEQGNAWIAEVNRRVAEYNASH